MKKFLCCSLAIAAIGSWAGEIFQFNRPGAWSYGNSLKLTAPAPDSLRIAGRGLFLSRRSVTIDQASKYRISGFFRSSQPLIFYFGAACLDAKRRFIKPENFLAVPGSDTVLAQDCLPTDCQVVVKNAAKWKKGTVYRMVGGTDASGKFRDLPNYNVSRSAIKNIKSQGENFVVEFYGAVGKYYAAGTPVREHRDAATHMYFAAWKKASPQWQYVEAVVSGVELTRLSTTHWRPGTKFARLLIIANSTNLAEGVLEAKNLKIEKLDNTK